MPANVKRDFKRDFDWGRKYIVCIKRALCNFVLEEAPISLDQREATDLMILDAKDVRYACRMREAGYDKKYGYQFTIRTGRPTGAKTELAKILDGFGDRFFYGFASERGIAIKRWCLIDLHTFRREYSYLAKKALHRRNSDRTTFDAWDVRNCPASLLISASWLAGPDEWVVRWEGQREMRL